MAALPGQAQLSALLEIHCRYADLMQKASMVLKSRYLQWPSTLYQTSRCSGFPRSTHRSWPRSCVLPRTSGAFRMILPLSMVLGGI